VTSQSLPVDFPAELITKAAECEPDEWNALRTRIEQTRALKRPTDEVDPPPFKVRSVAEMKADPPTEVPGLWGHHLHLGEMTSVCARGGLGKTAVTRNMLLHGAAGTSFMGMDFVRPLRWVYFGREGAGAEFFNKITTLADALGYDDDVLGRVHLVNDASDCQVRLTTDADFDKVRRTITERKESDGVDVVVFDPFTKFKSGSENDDKEMQQGLDRIEALQVEFDVASWVPHHASQTGTGMDAWRGSTAFEGTMATGLLMTRGEGGRNSRKIEVAKCRYSWSADDTADRYFDGDAETEVYVERDAPGAKGAVRAKMTLNVDWTIPELVKVTDLSETTLRGLLEDWEKAGEVTKTPGAGRTPAQYRRVASTLAEGI
jgi:hypothetical protein